MAKRGLVLFFLVVSCNLVLAQELTLCSQQEQRCNQIKRDNELKGLTCKYYARSVDILRSLENGTCSFASITAEEAAMGANLLQNVHVIAEARHYEAQQNTSEFETVVLLKKNVSSFEELRGLKYCHPGFDKLKVSPYVLNRFEEILLQNVESNFCGRKGTVAERYIAALSSFLGASCRPGSWVWHDKIDNELKSNYSNLCHLCDGFSIGPSKCSTKVIDPFKYSLECFQKGGEIAVTTLHEVRNARIPFPTYFCEDGKTSTTPCVWTKKSWPLVVAHRDSINVVKDFLNKYLNDKIARGTPRGRQAQVNREYLALLVLRDEENLLVYGNDAAIKNYVLGRNMAPEKPQCGDTLTWCTVSDIENEKCLWLKEASLSQGIYPGMQCQQKQNKLECMDAIEKNSADMVTINNNYGYISRRKKLVPVAFPETDGDHLTKSMIVTKNADLVPLSLNSLRDKPGCFAEFNDIAYLSFIHNLGKSGIIKDTCDYGKAISEFVADSCIPGARDSAHEPTKATDADKLCRLCLSEDNYSATQISCEAAPKNSYFDNNGALKCLQEVGEYAVISNRNITVDTSSYTVLCRNGTIASYPGLEVDDDCYLSVTVNTELVMRNDSKIENAQVMLSAFEKFFGYADNSPFLLFYSFDNTLDLLFEDKTLGLVFVPSDVASIQNYLSVFSHYDKCVQEGKNTAGLIVPYLGMLLMTFAAIYF